MKLSIETKFETYSVEFTNIDVSMEQITQALQGLLLACGYHIETINEYFKIEDGI